MEEDCIFCKIGKSNPNKVFEDELCYVVPDKFPTEFGHLLIISKEHYENLLVAPDETVGHIFIVAKAYGLKLKDKLGAAGITVVTNIGRESGQIIYHLHVHLVPKYAKRIEGFEKHRELTGPEAKKLKEILNS